MPEPLCREPSRSEALLRQFPTPFYLLDIPALHRRVAYLRGRLPAGTALCYAVKANPFLAGELAPLVERLEICSPGEAAVCLAAGVPEEKMVISGVYKTPAFIDNLMRGHPRVGWYTVESEEQFRLLDELSRAHRTPLRVLLRVSSGNQFGMDFAALRPLVTRETPYLHLCGLQYYSGTQKRSIKRLTRELTALAEQIESLRADGWVCEELEFGPGFPVAYFEQEDFDEPAFLEAFSALMTSFAALPPLVLELGRSMAAGCGSYWTRVVDKKRVGRENFAIVDGGIHQIAYFGQMMAMQTPRYRLFPPRPPAPPEAERSPEAERWNVCGSLCTVNDILLKQQPLPALEMGDVLVFEKAGAYCVTEGIALFLSRDLPAVVMDRGEQGFALCRPPLPTSPCNTPFAHNA